MYTSWYRYSPCCVLVQFLVPFVTFHFKLMLLNFLSRKILASQFVDHYPFRVTFYDCALLYCFSLG